MVPHGWRVRMVLVRLRLSQRLDARWMRGMSTMKSACRIRRPRSATADSTASGGLYEGRDWAEVRLVIAPVAQADARFMGLLAWPYEAPDVTKRAVVGQRGETAAAYSSMIADHSPRPRPCLPPRRSFP